MFFFRVFVYNIFEELILSCRIFASNEKEAEQKLRKSYPIASSDRIFIAVV